MAPHVVVAGVHMVSNLKVLKVTSSKVAYGLLLKGVKVLVDDLVWLVDR